MGERKSRPASGRILHERIDLSSPIGGTNESSKFEQRHFADKFGTRQVRSPPKIAAMNGAAMKLDQFISKREKKCGSNCKS